MGSTKITDAGLYGTSGIPDTPANDHHSSRPVNNPVPACRQPSAARSLWTLNVALGEYKDLGWAWPKIPGRCSRWRG